MDKKGHAVNPTVCWHHIETYLIIMLFNFTWARISNSSNFSYTKEEFGRSEKNG